MTPAVLNRRDKRRRQEALFAHIRRMDRAAAGAYRVELIRLGKPPQPGGSAATEAIDSWLGRLSEGGGFVAMCLSCDFLFYWSPPGLPHAFVFIHPDIAAPTSGGLTGICAGCADLSDSELLDRAFKLHTDVLGDLNGRLDLAHTIDGGGRA